MKEIVIKIPDDYNVNMGAEILIDAVMDGVELPKGHGRLIDADAFAEKIEKIISDKAYYSLKTDMISVGEVLHAVVEELNGTTLCGFENAPTIIEADTESEDEE